MIEARDTLVRSRALYRHMNSKLKTKPDAIPHQAVPTGEASGIARARIQISRKTVATAERSAA